MKIIYKVITSTLFSAGLASSFVGFNNAQALEAAEFSSFQNKLSTVSDSDTEVNIDGVLSASKKEILVGKDSADVIFYFNTLVDSDQFMLYQNDVPVGCFADSGNYEQDGDDIKGDGVYSLKFTVDVTGDNAKPTDNSKVVYNTYNVRYGDKVVSGEVSIDLITPFTDQELIDMSVADDAIDELMKSDEFKAMNQQEKIDSLMALLTNLSEKKVVNSIVLNEDRIEFLYSSEASGVILFTSFDEKNDGITTTTTETAITTTTETKIATTQSSTNVDATTTESKTDLNIGSSSSNVNSTSTATTTVGSESTLPQTGYSKWYQALIAAAVGMIGVGSATVVKSDVFSKREQ